MSDKKKTGTILDYQSAAVIDLDAPAFHLNWRKAKNERGISFKAPWENPFAGFPEHGRRCARALADAGMVVHLRSIDPSMQFQQRFETGGPAVAKLYDQYVDLLRCSVKNYIAEVCHVVADDVMFQQLVTHRFLDPADLENINRYRIVSTVFERDRISASAARCLNAMAEVWVANCADKRMLNRCGVERVQVVPIPYFPEDPLLKLRGRERQPGVVRFYHIGKWEHRKAHHKMLGAFLHAFAPGEAKLYFKTSTKAPDFGDYPSSPEASIRKWLEHDEHIASKWDMAAVNANVFLIKRNIPIKQIQELHRVGDVYLSLSRGEGFDMPAYDSKISGNLLVYTPSGGPQMYVSDQDIKLEVRGSVPCHSFYRWDDAEYLDWDMQVGSRMLRRAKDSIESGWSTKGDDLSRLSAAKVGADMRANVEAVVERGTKWQKSQ